ncbi:DUF6710 family protein [Paenisporosarcina sp. NPDC076898]|uniref:DUF6710 family protein n=1 Tax=unclassified Paenisporosarcina TaxID=2642018 RepID=UPI003D023420
MFEYRKKHSKGFMHHNEEFHTSSINLEAKNNFDMIMEFTQSVLKESKDFKEIENGIHVKNEHPLIDVVRLIGKQLQSLYLSNLLYEIDESDLPNLFPKEVLFDPITRISNDGTKFTDVMREVKIDRAISLNRDLVLPWSWKKSRLVTSIALIGEGRKMGQWCQDFNNHYVELWLPMGVAFVHGGNHSISTGIIQGKGEVIPRSVYDISDVYDYVYCDGFNYYRSEDGSVLSKVTNAEFAAIFEIGRMMREMSISF